MKLASTQRVGGGDDDLYAGGVIGGTAVIAGGVVVTAAPGKKFRPVAFPEPSERGAIIPEVRALELTPEGWYAAGTGGYFVSRDDGASWSEVPVVANGRYYALHRDQHGAWWLSGAKGRGGAGDEPVLMRSNDPERGWERVEHPRRVGGFFERDGELWLLGAATAIWDGTRSRTVEALGGYAVSAMTVTPSGALIAIGYEGDPSLRGGRPALLRSTDHGKTFAFIDIGMRISIADLAWIDDVLYVCGTDTKQPARAGDSILAREDLVGAVVASTDEGSTYERVKLKLPERLFRIVPDGSGAWLVGRSGFIAKLVTGHARRSPKR